MATLHSNRFIFFDRLEEELAAIPGADGVSKSVFRLLNYDNYGGNMSLENIPGAHVYARYNWVDPAYFQTFEIPLIAGRNLRDPMTPVRPRWPLSMRRLPGDSKLGRDIIGKRMGFENLPFDTEIVGVVKNTKYWAVRAENEPIFYFPVKQTWKIGRLTFYVRTASNPEQLFPAIIKAVARLDQNLPVERLCTMPQQVRENTFLERVISILSTAFACLATLLAAVGLYGILAYTVVQRTREMGLRIALGASPAQVRAIVFRQVGLMTIIGSAIGLVLALALGRLAESWLYYLDGSDPVVLCASAVVLGSIALTAGFIPALRASRLDPIQALDTNKISAKTKPFLTTKYTNHSKNMS